MPSAVITHPSCANSSRAARGGVALLGATVIGGAMIGLLRMVDNNNRARNGLPPDDFTTFLSNNVLAVVIPPLAGLPLAFWLAAEPQC